VGHIANIHLHIFSILLPSSDVDIEALHFHIFVYFKEAAQEEVEHDF
jgi:hypothetical protein